MRDSLYIVAFAIVALAATVVSLANSCQSSSPVEEIIYITVPDTTANASYNSRIISLEHRLRLTRDSLNYLKDSLGEDLVVAKIKLARIKEYNRIAAKGNNIKYLRGWINRTLEE